MERGGLILPVADKVFIGDSLLCGGCLSNQSLSRTFALEKRKKQLLGLMIHNHSIIRLFFA